MKVTINEIRDAELTLNQLQRRYVTERGWTYRSDFPDSRWRWIKPFDRGGPVTTTLAEAVELESKFVDCDEEEGN